MSNRHQNRIRADLTGEHRLGDAGQALIALVFIAVWILDSFVLHWTDFLNDIIPGWVQLAVGLPLLAIAGYLAWASVKIVFREVREPPVVIRTGLYSRSRHPMYFSEVLLYLGLLVLSTSLTAAVVWIVAIVFLRFLCRHEERLLVERFGDEYREYMKQVPMWVPLPGRRDHA